MPAAPGANAPTPAAATGFLVPEIVAAAEPEDERIWVPQADSVWFRPLMLDTVHGTVVNLLRIRRGGVYGRHVHPGPVHGYVIRGSWRYLEHDWVARAGSYVYEPPGEVHTLVVDGDHDEMVTFFNVSGGLINIDEYGRPIDYQDVFKKIALCDEHYRKIGLGPDFVRQFVR